MHRSFNLIVLISTSLLCPALSSRHLPTQEKRTPSPTPSKRAISQSLVRLSSPYDIERYINQHNDRADLSEVWNNFGIPVEQGKPGKCGCRGYDCPGTCKAEIIKASLNAGDAGYVVLRICYAGEADCWYLAFKKEQQWKYVGIAQSLDNQYEPPQHRIEKNKSEQWLVIKELWSRGTGLLAYGERWYELSDGGLREVLSYPVSGHSVQGATQDYELRSTVLTRREQHSFAMNIHYLVFTDGSPTTRWRSLHRHELLFVWDGEAKKFVLDVRKSKLPNSEIDPISKYLAKYRSGK